MYGAVLKTVQAFAWTMQVLQRFGMVAGTNEVVGYLKLFEEMISRYTYMRPPWAQ